MSFYLEFVIIKCNKQNKSKTLVPQKYYFIIKDLFVIFLWNTLRIEMQLLVQYYLHVLSKATRRQFIMGTKLYSILMLSSLLHCTFACATLIVFISGRGRTMTVKLIFDPFSFPNIYYLVTEKFLDNLAFTVLSLLNLH